MKALPLLVTNPSRESVVLAMATELSLSDADLASSLNLFRNGFPPLASRTWLPYLFGVSPQIVGAMETLSERYYRFFTIKRANGGQRPIETPRRFLKVVQRWVLEHILHRIELSPASYAYVSGRSIFDNARLHVPQRHLLVLDIQNFFPSVTQRSVQEIFSGVLPFSTKVAQQLAGLCTIHGRLPQGAPTSPALANAVFRPVDDALIALADRNSMVYSRYADDLSFSSDERLTPTVVAEVRGIVERAGFAIHPGKTRIVGPGQRQKVAGLVVNERAQPPREVRKRWRAIFHRATLHPREFLSRTNELRGISSFVNQYDPATAADYRRIADSIDAMHT